MQFLALRTFIMLANFDLEMSLVCQSRVEVKGGREVEKFCLQLASESCPNPAI